MELTKINSYYQNIIDLVISLYNNEFITAKAGHCMKITGFGNNELMYLWDEITEKYPSINTFIVSEDERGDCYISATKLIEFRNDYPAFNGKFKVIDTNNNELILSWEKDHKECTLYCDLLTNKSIIKYIDDNENLSIFNI